MRIVTSRATPLRAIPICWDGRFRHQHDGEGRYAQNQKELKQYYQQVDEQGNALWRGIALTRDDCIRRDVIKSLICNFRLDYAPIEETVGFALR